MSEEFPRVTAAQLEYQEALKVANENEYTPARRGLRVADPDLLLSTLSARFPDEQFSDEYLEERFHAPDTVVYDSAHPDYYVLEMSFGGVARFRIPVLKTAFNTIH